MIYSLEQNVNFASGAGAFKPIWYEYLSPNIHWIEKKKKEKKKKGWLADTYI